MNMRAMAYVGRVCTTRFISNKTTDSSLQHRRYMRPVINRIAKKNANFILQIEQLDTLRDSIIGYDGFVATMLADCPIAYKG